MPKQEEAQPRSDFARAFANRMRQLREGRFGTVRGAKSSAAQAIGVTPSDWRGYESGVIPGADKIRQICAAFECDANWLMGLPSARSSSLTAAQERIIASLVDVQEAVHAFDGMFTDCLLHLREVLTDPEVAQAQCFKLYAIAHRLSQLRKEIGKGETSSGET